MNGSIRESHRQHQQRYACNRCMLILVCLGADLEQSVLIRERANECVDRVRAELTAPTFSSADSGEQNVEHAPDHQSPLPPIKDVLYTSYEKTIIILIIFACPRYTRLQRWPSPRPSSRRVRVLFRPRKDTTRKDTATSLKQDRNTCWLLRGMFIQQAVWRTFRRLNDSR